MAGTQSMVDIYGARAKFSDDTAPPAVAEASGVPPHPAGPALFWATLVLLLVGARIVYEYAD